MDKVLVNKLHGSLILAIILMLLNSCHNKTAGHKNTQKQTLSDITLISKPTETFQNSLGPHTGVVGIYNTTLVTSQNITNQHEYSCYFKSSVNHPYEMLDGGNVKLESEKHIALQLYPRTTPQGHISYTSTESNDTVIPLLFEDTVRFSIAGNITNHVPAMVASIYAPAPLTLLSPTIQSLTTSNPLTDSVANNIPRLSKSKSIELLWNVDTANSLGVTIIIDWSGLMYSADAEGEPYCSAVGKHYIKSKGSKRYVQLVDDSGSFTIQPSSIQDFPVNALVHIKILRGGINTIQSKQSCYKFYALSELQTVDILIIE